MSIAFVLFCALASAVYIINDIVDAPQDAKHPFKSKRPIASGDLPIPIAMFVAVGLLFASLVLAWNLSHFFFILALLYLVHNFLYSVYFKSVPILDVMMIAAGFVMRVYAGALVVDLHMNVWFLLTVISLALFLAVGKRQSERTLLKGLTGTLSGHRSTLSSYTQRLLDIYTGMFATTTWLAYALYAFQFRFDFAGGPFPTLLARLPKTFVSEKWLMITVPVVIYGVMRYLQLVYEKNEGESPERVLLSDRPLLLAVIIWGAMVVAILY